MIALRLGGGSESKSRESGSSEMCEPSFDVFPWDKVDFVKHKDELFRRVSVLDVFFE